MGILYERKHEQALLKRLYESKEAEFLAIYGRRRIGKTFLIHQYFRDKGLYFEVTGIHQASLSRQLDNFATVFSDVFERARTKFKLTSWFDAFTGLVSAFSTPALPSSILQSC